MNPESSASIPSALFRLGDWLIDPSANYMSRDGTMVKIDGQHMRVLVLLTKHAGEIVSVQKIEDEVWRDESVTQNSIHQAIAQLRKGLGDDRKTPKYIETVARKGYRLIASVDSIDCISTGASGLPEPVSEHDRLRAPVEPIAVLQRTAAMTLEPSSHARTSVFPRLESKVIAGATVLLAALGAVVTWQYYATESAANETASANEMSEFMLQVFSESAQPNGETTVQSLTGSATQRLISNTKLQPLARARMLASAGVSYIRLGKPERAEQPLREAVGAYRKLKEKKPLAEALLELALVLVFTGRLDEVEAALKEASDIQVALGDEAKELKARILNRKGIYERSRGHHSNAVRFFEESLKEGRKTLGTGHTEYAVNLGMLGASYLELGNPSAAETFLREASEIFRTSVTELDPNRVFTDYFLGELRREQGRFDEAAMFYERTLNAQRRLYNSEGVNFAYTLGWLGWVRFEQHRAQEGKQMMSDAIELLKTEGGGVDEHRVFFQQLLAQRLLEIGDYASAERLLRECLDNNQQLTRNLTSMTTIEYFLGEVLLGQMRLSEASAALNSALHRATEDHQQRWRIERIRNALGEVLYHQGQISEGSRMLRESYDRLTKDPATNAITTRIVKKRMKWFAEVTKNNSRSKRAEPATASPPYPSH